MFGLGTFLFGIVKLEQGISIQSILVLLIGILILMCLKLYILVTLTPGVLFLILSIKASSKKLWLYFLYLPFPIATVYFTSSRPHWFNYLQKKQLAFKQLATDVGANSTVKINHFSSISELFLRLYHKPLRNVFIQPICPPNWTPFTLFASLEHILFSIVLVLPFFFLKRFLL